MGWSAIEEEEEEEEEPTDSRRTIFLELFHSLSKYSLVFHKDLFWGLCFSNII
jgi:hypothetical protein